MTVDVEDRDLEVRLRSAFGREAARTPLRRPEWTELQRVAPSDLRRRPLLAIAASVVLVAAGTVAVAQMLRPDPAAVQSVPPSIPQGDEFPLVELDPSDVDVSLYIDRDLVKPGSVSVFQAGDVIGFAYVSLDVSENARVTVMYCVAELRHTPDICASRPSPIPAVWWWDSPSGRAEEPPMVGVVQRAERNVVCPVRGR